MQNPLGYVTNTNPLRAVVFGGGEREAETSQPMSPELPLAPGNY